MVTPGLGPGYAVGKKGKKRSQIGKTSASQAVRSPNFFFSAHTDFLLLFPLTRTQSSLSCPGGYSHTLPIRVCAAQRGRDFEAPGLERGIHFRDVF